jgi:prepilin-type N-terminal cleavage/methylation domain-containing protein
MQRYNARNKKQGFTLTEMLVAMIVVGILAAIITPNFLGLLNQNRVKEAQRQVEAALKEAQRQAIRRGRNCTVTIDTSAKTLSSTNNCLLSTRTLDTQVSITANDGNANTISFTHKGIVSPGKTIVVYNSSSNEKKCVVVSDGLGSLRTGDYTGDVATTLTANSCTTSD